MHYNLLIDVIVWSFPALFCKTVFSIISIHIVYSFVSLNIAWVSLRLSLLSCRTIISNSGESGRWLEELGGVVGTWGMAVTGWTSEGFYKNNSLTDNLLASSLWRQRVPFGEGAFLFQLHRESPESQGWSRWVLIAFFPLFCQSAYSDEGKTGMKALKTLMKRSTNSFFSLWTLLLPAGWVVRRKRSLSSSLWLVDFEVIMESLAAWSVCLVKTSLSDLSDWERNQRQKAD